MGPLGEASTSYRVDPERVRALSARAARWVSSASYLKKWTALGVVIGAVAGLGAIVFYEALVACTHLFLGVLAGYQVPTPVGEGVQMASAAAARPWALPLVAGCGAPEASPALVAVGISWLIVRRNDDTIYRSQLKSRADAPAQCLLAGLPLLGAIPTTCAMVAPRLLIRSDMATASAKRALERANLNGAPVVDAAGRFTGTLPRGTLASPGTDRRTVTDLVDAGAPTVAASSRLDVALESLTEAPLSWVPVLDEERRVVGTLSVSDIVRAYRHELAGIAERMSGLGVGAGTAQVTIGASSPIAGRQLRQADLPNGLLVTSVLRDDRVFVPNGDTVLAAGDHLSVIGQAGDLERIGDVDPLDPTSHSHNGSSPPEQG